MKYNDPHSDIALFAKQLSRIFKTSVASMSLLQFFGHSHFFFFLFFGPSYTNADVFFSLFLGPHKALPTLVKIKNNRRDEDDEFDGSGSEDQVDIDSEPELDVEEEEEEEDPDDFLE